MLVWPTCWFKHGQYFTYLQAQDGIHIGINIYWKKDGIQVVMNATLLILLVFLNNGKDSHRQESSLSKKKKEIQVRMNFNHYSRMTNNLPTSQMYKETHTSVSILYQE